MAALPFALRRPWLLVRDLVVDRDRPDLTALGRLTDPERFLWAILPHAARTFSACIAILPAASARASAVAYLYCRMLDTYEDLVPGVPERVAALTAFAARFDEGPPLAPAPPIEAAATVDHRDRAHLLLVERCALVDRVHASLPDGVRAIIADLVRDMAEGMCWGAETAHRQGHVLRDRGQLLRYCRAVLGNPVLFVARLSRLASTGSADLTADEREDCLVSGEFIQLANVTRDIEKDLARGVAFHPRLARDLGSRVAVPDRAAPRRRPPSTVAEAPARAPSDLADRVRSVREELLLLALDRSAAYARLVAVLDTSRVSLTRASAVLMLLFTDRYYRGCAARAGRAPWGPRVSGPRLLASSLAAAVSRRRARRLVDRTLAEMAREAATGPAA